MGKDIKIIGVRMHKKTIKKGGREFGPYYYTTARTEGKVKTHYLGRDEEKTRGREMLSYQEVGK